MPTGIRECQHPLCQPPGLPLNLQRAITSEREPQVLVNLYLVGVNQFTAVPTELRGCQYHLCPPPRLLLLLLNLQRAIKSEREAQTLAARENLIRQPLWRTTRAVDHTPDKNKQWDDSCGNMYLVVVGVNHLTAMPPKSRARQYHLYQPS